ncbi:Alkaline phosphatase [Pseudoalteromonas luteoviolacea B = ATCC 29581]|nr:Alkaline phosphatase [Pseudoalteromonas luteoviolacea B = ATCC 29581]
MKNIVICSSLAILLTFSHQAAANCKELNGGASARTLFHSKLGTILQIKGNHEDETFTLNVSGDILTVARQGIGASSCQTFSYSEIDVVMADLGSGNDSYIATAVAREQTVEGGSGNDSISTGIKDDYLLGGPGNDTIFGNNGHDVIQGNDGDDELNGGNGNDTLSGGDGHDYLYGAKNNDNLSGDAGGDLIMGGQGKDVLYGDDGNDYLGGGCTLKNGNGAIIFSVSGCSGSDGNDTLYGGNGDDVLSGDSGDDKLYGNDGHDYLTGNSGYEDRLYGGSGRDLLIEVGQDNPDSNKWHKAWGGSGDDMIVAEDTHSYLSGGGENDAIIAVSSNYEAEMYGGDNGDFIWSGDAFPRGSCGSGDDKGMMFLDNCEGTTWVTDYQGLLTKLSKRSNYYNPYYEAANRVVSFEAAHTGFSNGWRTYGGNERPKALYGIVSSAAFNKWKEDQSITPYHYYEWKVSVDIGSGIVGEKTYCVEGSDVWLCRYFLTRETQCYAKDGTVIACS